jgi:ketosteroid isomerase-like protein
VRSDEGKPRFLAFVAENAAVDSADGRGPLRWTPTRAEALVASDVGYRIGTWERRAKDTRGNAVVRRGQYLTVWRKTEDGAWHAEFDTGSTAQ